MADIVRMRDNAAATTTLAALRALGERRPDTPGLELPAGTRRLALTYDSAFTPVDGFGPCPRATRG